MCLFNWIIKGKRESLDCAHLITAGLINKIHFQTFLSIFLEINSDVCNTNYPQVIK